VVAFWLPAAYSANYVEIVGSTLLSVVHDCKLFSKVYGNCVWYCKSRL